MAASGLEEKYDAVKQLIAVGKERGYLLYDEVNDSLPAEVHSSEEIDDLLTTFERNGIEIYEDAASAKAARAVEVSVERGDRDSVVKEDGHAEEGVSGSDLDLTPGSLEKTNDPVRMYLREMGTVPLLTREGEVTIAKRIERGQLVVMKAITRSPIVIKEFHTTKAYPAFAAPAKGSEIALRQQFPLAHCPVERQYLRRRSNRSVSPIV